MDVYFSMRSHADNTRQENLNPNSERRFTQVIRAEFQEFVGDQTQPGESQVLSLGPVAYHYRSFRKWGHLENIHFFHYSELKRDLEGQVGRLASVLGIQHPPEIMRHIVEGAGFDTMQKNAKNHSDLRRAKVFKDSSAFFASGTSENGRAN